MRETKKTAAATPRLLPTKDPEGRPLFARVINTTGFNPLPKGERGHGATDDLCCCAYCSPDGTACDNPDGVWDTLATDLCTGKAWKVHFPELHGRRRKRKDAWPPNRGKPDRVGEPVAVPKRRTP